MTNNCTKEQPCVGKDYHNDLNIVKTLTLQLLDPFGQPLYDVTIRDAGVLAVGLCKGEWKQAFPITPNKALAHQVKITIE